MISTALTTALFEAIDTNNSNEANRLIADGVDVNNR